MLNQKLFEDRDEQSAESNWKKEVAVRNKSNNLQHSGMVNVADRGMRKNNHNDRF